MLTAVSLFNHDTTIAEPQADRVLFIQLSSGVVAPEGGLTVDIEVSGTAINGVDYTEVDTTILIPEGEQLARLSFDVIDDHLVELDETIEITIIGTSDPEFVPAPAPDNSTTIVLSSNDIARVSIGDTEIQEGSNSSSQLIFDVSVDLELGSPFTVDFTTRDGSALAAEGDYTPVSGTLQFDGLAGETKQITVDITGDDIVELNEFFHVDLSRPVAQDPALPVDLARITRLSPDPPEGAQGIVPSPDTYQLTMAGDRVVFLGDFDGLSGDELYSTALDGGDPIRLSLDRGDSPGVRMPIRVTPTGHVMYSVDLANGTNQSYIVPADGSGPAIQFEGDSDPTFTPDGSTIVYTVGRTELYSRAFGGGPRTQLNLPLEARADIYDIVVSPDGTRVLYLAQHVGDTSTNLYSVPIGGGEVVKLNHPIPAYRRIYNHSFTPDSQTVLYWAEGENRYYQDVYAVNATGGTPRMLNPPTDNGTVSFVSAVTPDSESLIMAASQDDPYDPEIYVVPIAGGPRRKLSHDGGVNYSAHDPQLSPNSDTVFFRSSFDQGPSKEDLYSVPFTGGEPFRLTPQREEYLDVGPYEISSDGQSLLFLSGTGNSRGRELFSVPAEGGELTVLSQREGGGSGPVAGFLIAPDDDLVVYRGVFNSGNTRELFAARFGDSISAVGTIKNDDTATIFVEDIAFEEGNGGLTQAVFELTLDRGVDIPVSVRYGTRDGTATAGEDFMAADGTLVFPPSSISQSIQVMVPVIGEGTIEPDESFLLELSELSTLDRFVEIDSSLYSTITENRQVTPSDPPIGAVFLGSVSPDGDRVVFRGDLDVNDVEELYTVSASGGPYTKLNPTPTDGGGITSYRLSPDSRWVVFWGDLDVDDQKELYSVPIEGGLATKLNGPMVEGANVDGRFQITPDSSRVVYFADQEVAGVENIYSVPISGGDPVRLNPSSSVGSFQISPDSDMVVYSAGLGYPAPFDLYSVPIMGGPAIQLDPVDSQGNAVPGPISPNGKWASFYLDNNGETELHMVPIGGGDAVKVSGEMVEGGEVTASYVKFSEDSSTVYYRADQDVNNKFEVFGVPVEGGESFQITPELPSGYSIGRFELHRDLIIYQSNNNFSPESRLNAMPLSGGSPINLTPGREVANFAIDPDGDQVFFRSDFEIFRVPIIGGAISRIHPEAEDNVLMQGNSSNGETFLYLGDLGSGRTIHAFRQDRGFRATAVIVDDDSASNAIVIAADTEGTGIDNNIHISRSGSRILIEVDDRLIESRSIANVSSVTVNGQDGNDTLTIDWRGGNPFPVLGIEYFGGTDYGDDRLIIEDSSGVEWDETVHEFRGDIGVMTVDGSVLTYESVESPVKDYLLTTHRILDYRGEAVTADLGIGPVANQWTTSDSETLQFADPTSRLTVKLDQATDVWPAEMNLDGFGSAFHGDFVLQRGIAGTLTTNLSGNYNVSRFEIAGGSSADVVSLNGATIHGTEFSIEHGKVQGEGTVAARFRGGSELIVTNGSLTLGDGSPAAVELPEMVSVGIGTLTIDSADFTSLGNFVEISGGTLAAPGGVMLTHQTWLLANGTISAPVYVEPVGEIELTGDLTIGDSDHPFGFESIGRTLVGGHHLTLLDADEAVVEFELELGRDTVPGRVTARNGLLIEQGGDLIGHGVIDGDLINEGFTRASFQPGKELALLGHVSGEGFMDGNVRFHARYEPYPFPSNIDWSGNMAFESTSETVIQIGGRDRHEFDRFEVIQGQVDLSGALTVTTVFGFMPREGDWFEFIVSYNGLSGEYTQFDLPPLPADLDWHVDYTHTTARLVVASTETVKLRSVFYDNTVYDGRSPGANPADKSAIALDKRLLRPGEAAKPANYSNFARGINGLIIDVAGIGNIGAISLDDFRFRRGNDDDPDTWGAAPVPDVIDVEIGGGVGGSDRVKLIWTSDAVTNAWLEVTLYCADLAGLADDDIFYFGNEIGDIANDSGSISVDARDFAQIRSNPKSFLDPSSLYDPHDLNRDGRVNTADLLLVRDNTITMSESLRLITPTPMDNLLKATGDLVVVIPKQDLSRSMANSVEDQPRPAMETNHEEYSASVDAVFSAYSFRAKSFAWNSQRRIKLTSTDNKSLDSSGDAAEPLHYFDLPSILVLRP